MGTPLSAIYSAIDSAKRKARDLAQSVYDDPVEALRQHVANANNEAGENLDKLSTLYKNPAGQPTFDPNQWSPTAAANEQDLAGQATGAMMGATVWHGTPHVFDKFDSSKIGTGEGAQAYGHGLYFAEAPEVAKQYATAISGSPKQVRVGDEPFNNRNPLHHAALAVRDAGGDRDAAIAAIKNQIAYDSELLSPGSLLVQRNKEVLGKLQSTPDIPVMSKPPTPSLYQVDLPDQDISKMLDWNKPMGAQPGAVQSFANQLGIADAKTGEDLMWKLKRTNFGTMESMPSFPRGKAAAWASGQLNEAGVPGVRYLDAFSRDGSKQTSNYVVFPGNEGVLQIQQRLDPNSWGNY